MNAELLDSILKTLAHEKLKITSVRVMLHALSLPGKCLDWTKFSQVELAKKFGVKTPALSLAINALCKRGFLEKRGKTHLIEYRIVADRFRKEVQESAA